MCILIAFKAKTLKDILQCLHRGNVNQYECIRDDTFWSINMHIKDEEFAILTNNKNKDGRNKYLHFKKI